ncbi:Mitochondrial 37s ribosomal protein [Neofusicoccum parvum]|uniref:Mitochondrial 37s ribosomal protein n=2 Tax=Neofusicoccum parvum TaxID=310453 RepID=A0ACB5S7W1_9PEZI|nr:putative mitochondrial 37s ribosomal protein mrps16 protein [Neofusicoccum parvum UCRNP2]GME28905.1 Mitochondrial 37s ribosomal protein [Neofusicoccum parvum]GME64156.1 Mitochondrial 37s ribosomal protein [Neofusicoccum parvum]
MVLKIRLARFGKRHAPFYNIVVAHARTARDSKPLEVLGTYDPIPKAPKPGDVNGRPYKDIKLDRSRAQYWLGVGAQPSDTCWRLLSMTGLLEPKYRVGQIQEQIVNADKKHKQKPYVERTPAGSA